MTTSEQLIALDADSQSRLFRDARTANSFTDDHVTDDLVLAIYELVKWGPTSFNQQPLRIVLVRTTKSRERLVEYMWHNNKDKTRQAPLTAILAAVSQFHQHLPTQFPVFPQAGELFVDDDVRRESAAFNAALQIGYLIIGVRAAGLSAGPMSGFDVDGVSREFLPESHRALCVMNIGWPAEHAWSGRLPRLLPEQVFTTV
jgi:3-hydroxypropanoate dehydrogenase